MYRTISLMLIFWIMMTLLCFYKIDDINAWYATHFFKSLPFYRKPYKFMGDWWDIFTPWRWSDYVREWAEATTSRLICASIVALPIALIFGLVLCAIGFEKRMAIAGYKWRIGWV